MSTQTFNFWATVHEDARAVGYRVDPTATLLVRVLQTRRAMRHKPGFACVFWLRVNQYLIHKNWRGSYRLRIWRQYRFANDISPWATIGPGLNLVHFVDVTIGSAVTVGANAMIYNGVTLASTAGTMLTIGNSAIIYTGAKIIKPVQIGDNVTIGALTLCNKDIPSNSVAYGIPPNFTIKPK